MMETLYLLIPISVVLVFLIGIAFWWSLRNGQFDDLEGPAYRILMDDDRSRPVSPADDAPDKSPDAQAEHAGDGSPVTNRSGS
ncbi:cytochrome oxidase maturation protein, cbb3-type [Candidatus Accumulibacter phosphatis]|jgi:cbb3-type cytochrome oxidase maturation protein|uniref:Cytochrome oxidase maturation protein, cbb3-type n=2 Tax=Betaproteobacteria incertae sedis TaxID=119066 RepID=C7RS01_ACCRE